MMSMNKKNEPSKGEVYKYRVSKRETEGTEIMKTRLGVIFSTNELNKKGQRVVIIPLTSKKADKIYNYEVLVTVNRIKGKALLDQIRTINKSRLLVKKANLTNHEMKTICLFIFVIFWILKLLVWYSVLVLK